MTPRNSSATPRQDYSHDVAGDPQGNLANNLLQISHRYVSHQKPSKLSADERAFLNRIRSLNEEETEKLTFDELIAYLNIMHKIDPGRCRGGPFQSGRI
jgi:hypothetical protein